MSRLENPLFCIVLLSDVLLQEPVWLDKCLNTQKKRPGNPGGNFYVWIAPSDRNCVPFMSVTGLAETAIVAPVPIASPDMGAMWNFFESE
jgi:hypothetical protein